MIKKKRIVKFFYCFIKYTNAEAPIVPFPLKNPKRQNKTNLLFGLSIFGCSVKLASSTFWLISTWAVEAPTIMEPTWYVDASCNQWKLVKNTNDVGWCSIRIMSLFGLDWAIFCGKWDPIAWWIRWRVLCRAAGPGTSSGSDHPIKWSLIFARN